MNTFTIYNRLPGLNDLIGRNRSGWASGQKMKNEADTWVCWAIRRGIREGTLHPAAGPVRIRFEWHEKTRRRDLDNIFSAKKFILDALQKTKILEGDGQKHVTGFGGCFHPG